MNTVVIDGHSHMLQDFHPCNNLPQTVDDIGDVDVDGLLHGLDELGVGKVVTLSQEMTRARNEWLGSNELAADLQSRRGGRFVGIASFEPLTPSDQFNGPRFEQVRDLVRSGRVLGLLITPPYGLFHLNDRRAYPFYQMAVEYDVPIYVHFIQPEGGLGAEFNPPERPPQYETRLWPLEQVVADFPDLRFNIEHMARPWCEDMLPLMAKLPTVWTDITGVMGRPEYDFARYLKIAGERGFLDRMFWGTDYVGTDTSVYLAGVRKGIDFVRNKLNPSLVDAGCPTLTAAQIDGILGENVRRFLKL